MAARSEIRVSDLAGTRRVARRLAAALPPDACVAIEGDLGAGKTTFVKALAESVGIDPAEVQSPTFGLVHVHDVPASPRGRPPTTRLVHVDAYRLADAGDLASIGWEEIEQGPGWLVVEWPDRLCGALPDRRLSIRIEVTGVESRLLVCTTDSGPLVPTVDAIAEEAASAKLPDGGS